MTEKIWPEWTDKYTGTEVFHEVGYVDPSWITVEAGLYYIRGNSAPYFSVTAVIYERGKDVDGGCLHEMILKYFPQLAPVVALHLSDNDGTPIHAEANGLYHLGFGRWSERNDQYAADHFRIPVSEVPELIDHLASGSGYDIDRYAAFIRECIPRWKAEAANARHCLQELINEAP